MVREVRVIPPAPRRVRWRSVLGYRWPLGVLAFVLGIYGGLLTWMIFLAHGGKAQDDWSLDTRPKLQVSGVVRSVTPDSGRIDANTPAEKVDYEFDYGGQSLPGISFAPAGSYRPGQRVDVEMLQGEPNRNRIVGLRTQLLPSWLEPGSWMVAIVVPGLLVGLGYLAGVLQLRRILVHGDVSVAQVLAVRTVRFCLPETWSVRFAFRDHHATEHNSRHWVRAHSPLGNRVRTMVRHGHFERLPVLHDRRFPQHCRLVLPEDFAPDPNSIDPAATIRL